jgi:hypothetical protein
LPLGKNVKTQDPKSFVGVRYHMSVLGLYVNFLQNHLDNVFRGLAEYDFHGYCVGLILLSRLTEVGNGLKIIIREYMI